MRLQTSFFLAFAVATTLPMAITALVTRELIQSEFSDYYEQRLEWSTTVVREAYADLVHDEQNQLAGLCAGDPFLDAALVRLASPGPVPQIREQLQAWAARQASALHFDTLDVLSPDSVVLASAHYPGRRGEPDRQTLELAEQATATALLAVVTRHGPDGDTSALTLLTACRAQQAGQELVVLGGRLAGQSVARRIASRLGEGDVFVFVLDEARRPIDDVDGRWERSSRLRRVLVPLENPDGSIPAQLAIAVDDARELRTVERLQVATLAVIAFGVVISWLLGMVIARRIGRPLARLAGQAAAVSQGELGLQVDVKAGGEVGELVAAFNKMTVDLRESRSRLVQAERIAAWRDIARRIAHEIKNPLFPIQTSIETMRKAYRKQLPDFEEIFDESTLMILEEVERLKRIVTEFSRFARLPKPAPEALDVNELVGSVAALYGGQAVEVATDLPDGLPQINADREQLTQVLHNLIQNAIDAVSGRTGDPPARVEVSARATSGGVAVSVQDNGTGMDPGTVERIFEPYFTTKEGRGTGLGLAIVHRIVTDHEGTIDVRTEPGRGSTFTVFLTVEGPPSSRASVP
jgi:signal transduction histidine kinase